MSGGTGNDSMYGGRGQDTLNGGEGADILTGGLGKDTFEYSDVKDSVNAPGQYDTVTDFHQGVDKIDLSGIDANIGVGGDQAFQYVAYDPNKALDVGQVTSHYDAGLGKTVVEGNIDALGDAEFRMDLNGNVALDQNSFNL